MSIFIFSLLTAIAAFFLAVKSYKNLKELRHHSLIVVGAVLTLIVSVKNEMEDMQISDKVASDISKFSLRLDSVKTTSELNQLTTDYDRWALNLPTELQIRELKEQQDIINKNAEKLTNRAFTTYSFNCMKASLANYTTAFNNHFENSFEISFQETNGLKDESVAILRGDKNTYYVEFRFNEKKHLSKYTDGISFYAIPNKEFDQSMNSLNTKDTVEMVLMYAGFELSLLNYLRFSFQIDRDSSLMKVSEYDGLLLRPTESSKIFKSQYNLRQSARQQIDLIAQQLFEKILMSEDWSLQN